MTICPFAEFLPTANASRQKAMTEHDIVCTHTTVAPFASVLNTWRAPSFSGPFAHFLVAGSGRLVQAQDLDLRAAANLEGNPNVVSIENADKGESFPSWGGSDVPAFTDAQVQTNIRLQDWLCTTYNIPRSLIPDTLPARRGLGYHRQGISGNYVPYDGIVAGGRRWSNATGKMCPGDRRKAQLIDQIIPALQGAPAPPTGDQMLKLHGYVLDDLSRQLARRSPPATLGAVFPALAAAWAAKGNVQDGTVYTLTANEDIELIDTFIQAFELGPTGTPGAPAPHNHTFTGTTSTT